MNTSNSDAWDIFLAHAGPDLGRAEALYEILDEKGFRVFLDSRCMRPGDSWAQVLADGLHNCALIAVLVSAHTDKAFYEREEIARAIELGRDTAFRPRVVPIYLDGMPRSVVDRPYGLASLHSLDLTAGGGLDGVAQELAERIDDRGDVEAKADSAIGGTYLGYFHAAALELDRTEQWHPLVKQCRSDEDALFMLHGERRQNLELFVARLWHYLPEESERPLIIVPVPWRVEYATPQSPWAWENHVRAAFPGREGTAEELLRESSRNQPVFLILSEWPLGVEDFPNGKGFEALEGFLNDRLPALIVRSRDRHPIRALLAFHYEPDEHSLKDRLEAQILDGVKKKPVFYRKLPKVRQVEWSHIEAYLDTRPEPPPQWVYESLRAMYDSLDHERVSFRELVERLQRYVSR